MNFFWPEILRPLLEGLRPRSVIEIGCDRGATTRHLLEWCATHDATVHGIDPVPQFDADAWMRESAGRFVFHRALSLDVLPGIPPAEAVLIDGDHNWFTVINELRVLARKAEEASRPFPLTFLHDVAWPYARRDLYHAPKTIPPAWCHPYVQLGLRVGSAEPVESGINAHRHHARHEGGPRNGVLTAVEDFIAEAKLPFEFIVVPGLFGLGILTDRRLLEASPELAAALAPWRLPEKVRAYVERVEQWRLGALHRPAEEVSEPLGNVLVVCVTDMDPENFRDLAPLGLSIGQLETESRLQTKIVVGNTGAQAGLATIYNRFLTAEFAGQIVIFTHDDVHLDDWFVVDRLGEAMRHFDIVGVAGNRSPDFSQPSWALEWDKNGKSRWQPAERLSGCVSHIVGDTTRLSRYGPTPAPVELLDGCFIAVNVSRALAAGARFDERFQFHFYDLDFCRTCRARGLRLGTWPIAITHASGGDFGSPVWESEKQEYFAKWPVG
jgi:Methyltransferase domain